MNTPTASHAPASLADPSVINYYGRNYITPDKVTFLNSVSGFEVRLTGRILTAVFTRRGRGSYAKPAEDVPETIRLRVDIDGARDAGSRRVLTLDDSTDGGEVVLAEFPEGGEHTVLVRKMNYDFRGYVELRSLATDGAFLPAPVKPEKKLLVYGDSITVGYGVEYAATGDVGGDVPEKEDGTRCYAALLADHLGAQIAEYCNSGVSIGIPCWREHTVMGEDYWHQYAYFDAGSVWDMAAYVPDLILCNLGTNDNGGLSNGTSNFGNGTANVPADHYTPADLERAYADFIRVMKSYYPQAKIIMSYGMMGRGPSVDEALAAAVRDCGYDDVYHLRFRTVECSANAGHPTLAGQEDGFRQLLAFMEEKEIRV